MDTDIVLHQSGSEPKTLGLKSMLPPKQRYRAGKCSSRHLSSNFKVYEELGDALPLHWKTEEAWQGLLLSVASAKMAAGEGRGGGGSPASRLRSGPSRWGAQAQWCQAVGRAGAVAAALLSTCGAPASTGRPAGCWGIDSMPAGRLPWIQLGPD